MVDSVKASSQCLFTIWELKPGLLLKISVRVKWKFGFKCFLTSHTRITLRRFLIIQNNEYVIILQFSWYFILQFKKKSLFFVRMMRFDLFWFGDVYLGFSFEYQIHRMVKFKYNPLSRWNLFLPLIINFIKSIEIKKCVIPKQNFKL